MAEGGSNPNPEGETWESWFGGWMQTAKEKSQTALEFVKKDLAEFGSTVQKETEKAVEITKGSLAGEGTTEATNKVKSGLSSFLDNISKALVIPHDDDDYVPMKVAADGSGLYDRGKARLHALQLDAGTYVDTPRGSPEQYSMWLESFSLDEHKGEISELLVSKVEVRALYTKLVPSEVSNADFWQRYFYRVHQLQCDEARKQALMMRADQTGGKESVSWDDDDDDDVDDDDDDDDGNHSDWEKMPRPPQSYAAQQKAQKAALQEKLDSSKAAESGPSAQSTTEDQNTPTTGTDTSDQQAAAVSRGEVEADLGQQTVDMKTSASAFAAEPSSDTPTEQVPSQSADASGESSVSSPAEVVTNPWSLHIPEDLASASDAAEEEAAGRHSGITPAPRAQGPPAVVHGSEGSAAGAEVALPVQAESHMVPADGACGAADVKSEHGLQQPAAEVSTAGPAVSHQQKRETSQSSPSQAGSEPSSTTTSNPSPPPAAAVETPADSSSAPVKPTPSPLPPPAAQDEESKVTGAEKAKDSVSAVPEDKSAAVSKETAFVPLTVVRDTEVEDGAECATEPAVEEATGAVADASKVSGGDGDIAMKVKGDMVVVGDRDSPSSTESTDTKDLGLDEDWEQFDVEITEEDLKAAEDIAKRLGENLDGGDDDWENWE